MSNILCLETSGPHCSLAVKVRERIFTHDVTLGRKHNEELLKLVKALLEEARLSVADLDLLAISHGPGSFTGVRISAAVAQALAYVADAQVVTIGAHEVLFHSAAAQPESAVTSVYSRGEAFYLALYEASELKLDNELCSVPPQWLETLLEQDDKVRLLGQMPPWLADKGLAFEEVAPRAEHMMGLAAARYEAGLAGPASSALPVYLAADSPWKQK